MKKNVEKKTENSGFRGKLERLEKKLIALIAAATLSLTPVVVSAEAEAAAGGGGTAVTSDATKGFDKTIETVMKYGEKAGLAVTLVGGIMFAFAFKNNDAEQKTSAIQTMIAGAIVFALCFAGKSAFGL